MEQFSPVHSVYRGETTILETEIIKESYSTLADFIRYSEEENQDECLEVCAKLRISDEAIKEIIRQDTRYLKLGELPIAERNIFIQAMHKETGASIRQ